MAMLRERLGNPELKTTRGHDIEDLDQIDLDFGVDINSSRVGKYFSKHSKNMLKGIPPSK